MKLTKFSITNFRSITKAHEIYFKDVSILVGKNNEGKSNILKALNIAINTLKQYGSGRIIRSYRRISDETQYSWERDFPVQLKDKKIKKITTFELEFTLTEEECLEFKSKIGSFINGIISIQIRIEEDNRTEINIKKRGKTGNWMKNSSKIVEHLLNKIEFIYIPTIRTEEHVISIVESMIEKELSKIEDTDSYQNAMKIIDDLQTPILNEISKNIEKSLKKFIPDMKEVEMKTIEHRRRLALRRDTEILIDDGIKTSIEYKGDGVKSLVALSLLKDGYSGKGVSFIAIEEPESHLHPEAIHSLKNSIYELGKSSQVIISTHNPLFINSDDIQSNIIVHGGKAKPAKNIGEIRDVLGVRVSDNLTSARYVFIVEGLEDEISLKYLLPYYSEKIKKAISNRLLVIDNLKGASKLSYKLGSFKTQLCKYHVLLDNDNAGKTAFENARESGLLDTINTTFTIAIGKNESEFEDLLDPSIYKDKILQKYGVNINCTDFNGGINKWSERVKKVFEVNGKLFDQKLEDEIKNLVAESIKGNESIALFEHNKNIFNSLVQSLENLIKE